MVKRSCNYMLLYWVYVNSWLCFFTQDCCVASALECFRSQVLDLSVTDAKLKRSQKIVFNELRKSLIVSVCLLCLWAEWTACQCMHDFKSKKWELLIYLFVLHFNRWTVCPLANLKRYRWETQSNQNNCCRCILCKL